MADDRTVGDMLSGIKERQIPELVDWLKSYLPSYKTLSSVPRMVGNAAGIVGGGLVDLGGSAVDAAIGYDRPADKNVRGEYVTGFNDAFGDALAPTQNVGSEMVDAIRRSRAAGGSRPVQAGAQP